MRQTQAEERQHTRANLRTGIKHRTNAPHVHRHKKSHHARNAIAHGRAHAHTCACACARSAIEEKKRVSRGASYGPDPSVSATPSALPRILSSLLAPSSRTPPASALKIGDSEVSFWPKPAGGGGGDHIGGELFRISSFPRCFFSFIPGPGSP